MCEFRAAPQAETEQELLEAIHAAVKRDDHDEVSRLDRALCELRAPREIAPSRPRLYLRPPGRQA